MERKPLKTADGSYTLHLPEWDEQYHSKNGALAEAVHVFIKNGLHYWLGNTNASNASILEIGFGTGLNCLLTYCESQTLPIKIDYVGVEGFPLNYVEVAPLKYPEALLGVLYSPSQFSQAQLQDVLSGLHNSNWNEKETINDYFSLLKLHQKFSDITISDSVDIIYFDAFGIRVQPQLWTDEIFEKMFSALRPGGILVTYAANGQARRAMMAVGFQVEKLPGPPGKKEMLRATKKEE